MKKCILWLLICLITLQLCGCAGGGEDSTETTSAGTVDVNTADTSQMNFSFTDRELAGTYTQAVDISADPGQIITKAGTYILSGKITDTTVTIAVGENDKVQLVLDNATIENGKGPAIYVKSGDKVFITLKEGTVNAVSDGSSYEITDEETTLDAAIFSRADLTINGGGTLNVNGNYKHGITSKDDLVITAENLSVSAKNAGLDGKDCVKLSAGTVTINAGSDGIRSDNAEDANRGYVYIQKGAFYITAGNDGIQAETVLKINTADMTVTAGGGSGQSLGSSTESFKGLKAGSDILIAGGSYTIDSKDDCIHSNNTVSITDGAFVLSSGDDGIHGDTDLGISGGYIRVTKSYEGLEATNIKISGGEISVVASDDGINAAGGRDGSSLGGRPGMGGFSGSTGTVVISGGYLVVDASGDGLDSNGTLEITEGITLVSGPTNSGNGTLDYENSANITGGTLMAIGSSGMAQSIGSSGERGVLACTMSTQSGGTSFIVLDSEGKVVLSFTPAKAYNCAVVTSPNMIAGNTYSVVVGGTVEGADENGFATNTTYTGGTLLGSLEITNGTSTSGMMGGGGPGGRPGGNRPGGGW